MKHEHIKSVFDQQKKHSFVLRLSNSEERIIKLKALKKGIEKYEEKLFVAMQKDLRKSRFETAVTEIYFTYAEIEHAIKKLKSWMKPVSVSKNLSNFFSSNKIYYEPKGVCLIIAPWNYPFQLLMSPLVSAIAAGNCAIVKPSEISSYTADLLSDLISELYPVHEIACFKGDSEVSKHLLELPFDHIFFTGSTAVGKIVMEAASKNLSSVTLELGGKSPTIVDSTADLEKTAEKIAWGKLVNAGQTCIAPDYVLIEESIEKKFIGFYKAACLKMFFKSDTEINEAVYGKIINEKQFMRLTQLIKSSVENGAAIEWGGQSDLKELTIFPTVLTGIKGNNAIMQEEIFGPVLPIITFEKLDEAISFINSKSKPLALYMFSENNKNINQVLQMTSSGGTCINDVLVHISNPNLPFGGVNASGIGSCHGIYGFKNFSHERSVVFQSKLGITRLIYPPYDKKSGILKWIKRIL